MAIGSRSFFVSMGARIFFVLAALAMLLLIVSSLFFGLVKPSDSRTLWLKIEQINGGQSSTRYVWHESRIEIVRHGPPDYFPATAYYPNPINYVPVAFIFLMVWAGIHRNIEGRAMMFRIFTVACAAMPTLFLISVAGGSYSLTGTMIAGVLIAGGFCIMELAFKRADGG